MIDCKIDRLSELQERIQNRKIGNDICFFCANQYPQSHISMEHVFPKWLQNKFDLWEQQIHLLNKSLIRYRQLAVPCCSQCNNKYLSTIEKDAKFVCENGIKATPDLKLSLFLWLSKIWYGLLYKELFMLYDQSNPEFGTIADTKLINQYSQHLEFMQTARGEIRLEKFDPFSIFAFECQTVDPPSLNYDYIDESLTMVSGIRMGKVGIIIVFQDGGAQQGFDKYLCKEAPFPLHPIQFREVCAKIIYKESIRDRTPKWFAIESENIIPTYYQLPLGGFSRKPFYRDWEMDKYAQYLSFYTGKDLRDIYSPPDRVCTWLRDKRNKPMYIPFTT